jgi:UPF0176 protein
MVKKLPYWRRLVGRLAESGTSAVCGIIRIRRTLAPRVETAFSPPTPVFQHFKSIRVMSIINLSAYKFVTIESGADWRSRIVERCQSLGLRGTILLAPEGINLFVAGAPEQITTFMEYLRTDALFEGKFADLEFKESVSSAQPFGKMLVKLKREIITMKKPAIRPELGRAPSVGAATLRSWLDQGHDDEGRPVVMLDTRNAFEVDVGTFDQALDYRIDKFSEFPAVIEAHRADLEGKTVVSFCTGGIRCEKAAIHMKEVGIDHVYQLEGGILKYFEEVGGAHYHGECFVFDHRTALNSALEPAAPENDDSRAAEASTGSASAEDDAIDSDESHAAITADGQASFPGPGNLGKRDKLGNSRQ